MSGEDVNNAAQDKLHHMKISKLKLMQAQLDF